MKIQFTKMQALGNDFVVIDLVNQSVKLTAKSVSFMGDRHLGIGFDQLLLIEKTDDPEADFQYRIFNADGSESYQCGNGARCIAKFIAEKQMTDKTHIKVKTKLNLHNLILRPDKLVTVNMQVPELIPEKIPFIAEKISPSYAISTEFGDFNAQVLSMGNPHCVLTVSDVANIDVDKIGRCLSLHSRFPEHANVSFMQIVSKDEVHLRVYERGTGETSACGSGACASMVAGRLQGALSDKVLVKMPGGQLSIEWQGDDHPVWMTGPAFKVFEGEIELPIHL